MSSPPVFLVVFFAIFFAVGFAILGLGLRSWHMSKQAATWPAAEGQVLSRDFDINTDEDGSTYQAEIRYAYSVNGVSYEGKKIAFGYVASSNRSLHQRLYDALTPETRLAVRYDPSRPSRAVLSHGANQTMMFMIIFGLTWTAFTTGMATMFWLNYQSEGGVLENMVIYAAGGV